MIIALPRYTGEISLTREGAYGTLAHHGPRDLFTLGRNYSIGDRTYSVLSNTPSQYVPAITLVRLKEIT